MLKKTMLAVVVAALAFAALPTLAAATTSNLGDPYLSDEGKEIKETHFTVSGKEATLTSSIGNIHCEEKEIEGKKIPGVTGTGKFEDEETGYIEFTFHSCKGPFGVNCTTSESPTGTITTTKLPFHLKTVTHKNAKGETEHKPGVLITPGPSNEHGTHFASFTCTTFIHIQVGGNGIIGTIETPNEEVKSNTWNISFEATEAGSFTQTHRFVTGDETEYDLKIRSNEGETKTAAEDATGTLTFAEGMEPEIKTTPNCV